MMAGGWIGGSNEVTCSSTTSHQARIQLNSVDNCQHINIQRLGYLKKEDNGEYGEEYSVADYAVRRAPHAWFVE